MLTNNQRQGASVAELLEYHPDIADIDADEVADAFAEALEDDAFNKKPLIRPARKAGEAVGDALAENVLNGDYIDTGQLLAALKSIRVKIK